MGRGSAGSLSTSTEGPYVAGLAWTPIYYLLVDTNLNNVAWTVAAQNINIVYVNRGQILLTIF